MSLWCCTLNVRNFTVICEHNDHYRFTTVIGVEGRSILVCYLWVYLISAVLFFCIVRDTVEITGGRGVGGIFYFLKCIMKIRFVQYVVLLVQQNKNILLFLKYYLVFQEKKIYILTIIWFIKKKMKKNISKINSIFFTYLWLHYLFFIENYFV